LYDVTAERGTVGHIECALPALGQTGTCGGNDDGIFHDLPQMIFERRKNICAARECVQRECGISR
jgi:hypothetical protein